MFDKGKDTGWMPILEEPITNMQMIKTKLCLILFFLFASHAQAQVPRFNFRIRTITAGVTLRDLSDTLTINRAVSFLKQAQREFTNAGYEVQTIRIATSNLYTHLNNSSLKESLPFLKTFDNIATRNGITYISIGQILAPQEYQDGVGDWVKQLCQNTKAITFNLSISSHQQSVHSNSVKAAAEIITSLAQVDNGEANFRFAAIANCPANIPFFPAAFHEGVNSFAVGLETPNLLTAAFNTSDRTAARQTLRTVLEQNLKPVEKLAEKISTTTKWKYDGIDVSPAPGLDASIGEAIETYTKQPFGSSSTLSACALITDVLKSLSVKKCGYSGLMLPVIEDKVLAQRAAEQRYTVQELLLYSAVSGTGLDVVPIAGDTPKTSIEGILTDVAALSLKYTEKALSVRLFPIPNKKTGEKVTFDNPYLTGTLVMKVD
jgi:uncharacterized protein (UPF0210 family)